MSSENIKQIPAHQARMIFRFNEPVNSNSRILEMGKLKLMTEADNILFSATSGLPGFQSLSATNKRGKGRIPTCLQVGIINYWVGTKPIYLPTTKGVNGNFYPITPFLVKVGNEARSDLGIHKDTNVPGSAGCIVLGLEDHWQGFEIQMKKLSSQGIIKLPLMVF